MDPVYKKKLGTSHDGDGLDFTVEDFLKKSVNGEMSIFVASKQYNISYETLYNRCNGKYGNKLGG